ncbi:MAG: hypothetical protein GY820_45940 [Gammaproteobacteria bacterium]|nr:hypothetical protein [Gammaproteobacteria bacterium]
MNDHEKSDRPIVPEKGPNKAKVAAEGLEERGRAKENSEQPTARRTQRRDSAQVGLDRVRVEHLRVNI